MRYLSTLILVLGIAALFAPPSSGDLPAWNDGTTGTITLGTVKTANANVGSLVVTNPITQLDVTTLTFTGGSANVVPVLDGNTNLLASATSTNDLNAIAGKATVLSHYMGTDTNLILAAIGGAPLAGATFTGSVLVGTTNIIGELASKGSGGGIAGTVINTGASTAKAIPYYSDTTGTNIAPGGVSIDGTGYTNLVAGSHQFGVGGLVAHVGLTRTNSLSLEQPDSNTVGNALGVGATDLQIGRNAAADVASGANSFACGTNNIASATYSFAAGTGNNVGSSGAAAFGSGNIIGASFAFAAGANNNPTHNYATSFGLNGASTGQGSLNFTSGKFSTAGDCQGGFVVARAVMTTATSGITNLLVNADPITVLANATWHFDGLVLARSTGNATTETNACFTVKGCISRDNTAASTTLLWSTVTTDYAHAAAAAWTIALSADTTNGALVITATGDTCVTIRWGASIRLIQVGG